MDVRKNPTWRNNHQYVNPFYSKRVAKWKNDMFLDYRAFLCATDHEPKAPTMGWNSWQLDANFEWASNLPITNGFLESVDFGHWTLDSGRCTKVHSGTKWTLQFWMCVLDLKCKNYSPKSTVSESKVQVQSLLIPESHDLCTRHCWRLKDMAQNLTPLMANSLYPIEYQLVFTSISEAVKLIVAPFLVGL